MMERLTERTDIGIVGNNATVKNYPLYKVAEYDELDHGITGQCFNKLAEYEDAEEQGLLLRLPCKLGDTIYVVPSITNYRLNNMHGYSENNRVYEQVVHYVQIFGNDRYLLFTCDGLRSVVSDYYKETWFLTREEAEQKLKEMESDCNDKN